MTDPAYDLSLESVELWYHTLAAFLSGQGAGEDPLMALDGFYLVALDALKQKEETNVEASHRVDSREDGVSRNSEHVSDAAVRQLQERLEKATQGEWQEDGLIWSTTSNATEADVSANDGEDWITFKSRRAEADRELWIAAVNLVGPLIADWERLRRFFFAWVAVENGVVDFDLHAETVEEFRAATAALEALHREALAVQRT